MKQISYRLKPSINHSFSGHALNRDKRFRFTLNGREFKAYEGDTILTALLANGVFSAGQHAGGSIALDAALDLSVRLSDGPTDASSALPISRTPAMEGLSLEVFGAPKYRLQTAFSGARDTSLQIDFDQYSCVPAPLFEAPITTRLKVNLLIVGGGIAGMTAAVTAAEAGKNVILIERRGYLGGDAELFGYADGEDDPRDTIKALKQKIAKLDKIKVFTLTEALDLEDRKLLAHFVEIVDNRPQSALMRISARNVILATGAADKLPLFPGNRLPRIGLLTEVFHLASAYGIWRGEKTAVFTNTNIAYRFAGQVQNAEAKVTGVYDVRVNRSSRFIEIAKAGGLKTVNGAKIRDAGYTARTGLLNVNLEPAHDGLPPLAPFRADQLIINDGWRPRLNLWRMAGGKIGLDGAHLPENGPENVMLAGSCAGLIGHIGVQQSAVAAVGELMLKKQSEVSDPQIDARFETPEGSETVSSAISDQGLEPVYVSSGGSLVTLKPAAKKNLLAKMFQREPDTLSAPIADRALGLWDTLTLVRLGMLPKDAFEPLLKERAIAPRLFEAGETRYGRKFLADSLAKAVPSYVGLRFGAGAQSFNYVVESGIPLQTGVLLFPNTDVSDPLKAIGLVVGDGDIALVRSDMAAAESMLVARIGAQSSTIRLLNPTDQLKI